MIAERSASAQARMLTLAFLQAPTYLTGDAQSPFEPCIPTRGTKVPDRPEWIHEIKQDSYRLISAMASACA